jgi:hypothetical protein
MVANTIDPENPSVKEVTVLMGAVRSFIEMEEIMFTIDVPYAPIEEAPIVLTQTSAEKQQPQPDYILKSCTEKEHAMRPNSAIRFVDPAGVVADYIRDLRNKALNISDFKPILLSGPKYGTLKYTVSRDTSAATTIAWGKEGTIYRGYVYDPVPGFLGEDSATFMVEFEDKYYKVEIEIQVRTSIDDHDNQGCNFAPKVIKVRKPTNGNAGDSGWGLSESISFSDLSGSALAQTTGTGTSAQITLDTNAAGHGWFIDYTPYLNEEWLPTSSPYRLA